jgi:hypothetical protein
MGIFQAQHNLKKHKRAKIAVVGIAGVASVVAVVTGTAHAGGARHNVHIIDSGASYAHAVDIGVDGQERGCRIVPPAGSGYAEFGPRSRGSDVWIREFRGTRCSYPNNVQQPIRTVHLTNVRPGAVIDLRAYTVSGWSPASRV